MVANEDVEIVSLSPGIEVGSRPQITAMTVCTTVTASHRHVFFWPPSSDAGTTFRLQRVLEVASGRFVVGGESSVAYCIATTTLLVAALSFFFNTG